DIITAEQAAKMETSLLIDVDDPLYPSQTNITATNIDDVWEQYTTGDGSQVIAILDTGGDYTHPDLEANTWINEAELNGVEGYDDDGNGYVDDIRGWDFINLDNAPLDDNMHGTHVAGIAGAVGNNGIGIAGAAWDVKLMHIKVFQSTGQGNSTNIAAGVEYASSNGAGIINMSFGSYAESFTLKSTLENAYATATLVAASGNNGIPLGPCTICAVFYPAAYSYVLGVEDSEGGYNNYDNNNPIFTQYAELFNYELKAPGTAIMSTIPNGGYSTLTGTSMATPLVAGAIALYNQIKPEDSGELMMGSLINTSGDNPIRVNILAAIESEPTPLMALMLTTTRDTINNQNGNGFIEPEETIEILPTIKNYWGPTEDVRVGIEFAEFEDQTKATIVQDEIQIGSISAYATLQDLEETLKITISEGVANNVDIKFVLTAWSGPNQEFMSDPVEFVINVKNSILLYGIISNDMTLTSDRDYLVPSQLVFDNAHIIIEPGTTLSISDNVGIKLVNGAKITAIGNKNNGIYFVAENNYWTGFDFSGNDIEWQFDFCEFKNFRRYWHEPNSIETNFTTNSLFFDNTFLADGYTSVRFIQPRSTFSYNNILDNNMREGAILDYSNSTFYSNATTQDGLIRFKSTHNNVIGNRAPAAPYPVGGRYSSGFYLYGGIYDYDLDPEFHLGNSINNTIDKWTENVIGESGAYVAYIANLHGSNSGSGVSNTPNVYIGTSIEDNMRDKVRDYLRPIETNGNVPINVINLSNVDPIPDPLAHGIVWKIEVNDFDAQDEYALIEPIGVGTHEFKVYFNREMDTSVDPRVSYGVTIPYVQKNITEEGTWSSDGKIYTVTHEVNIGAADGINRIRVQDAQDLDYFKIPVEDTRFNFLLQSAGSASTGFFASGGLGKIDLEWMAPSAEELDDVLGYNMYRYQI
ncbi:S8 family serine peptidase, partial [bacterium]|nr:S8 family serine peptidase [bacterium]